MSLSTVRAWHFVGATLRDGSPIPADGNVLKFNGDPVLCETGLHASQHPFDALLSKSEFNGLVVDAFEDWI
jgi:hypothetical protein